MNTKIFSTLEILLIFILTTLVVSCGDDSLDDPFLVCKAEEHDCEYNIYAKARGILTVTKGSSRKHYVLTEKGLKKAVVKEGEPVSYNPRTKLAVVEERTDSSVEISIVNTENGKIIFSGIEIPVFDEVHDEENEEFALLSSPTVESGCVADDGTVILLVDYEQPKILRSKRFDFLFVYEKGDAKKAKKYVFPNLWNSQEKESSETERPEAGFEESPLGIQCGKEGAIYLFSAKIWASGYFSESVPPIYAHEKLNLNPKDGEANITSGDFIAFNGISSYYYSEKTKTLYTFSINAVSDAAVLRTLKLGEYETPGEIVEKEDGRFLFSETADGKPLVFFVKNRKGAGEEQRLELLDLQF